MIRTSEKVCGRWTSLLGDHCGTTTTFRSLIISVAASSTRYSYAAIFTLTQCSPAVQCFPNRSELVHASERLGLNCLKDGSADRKRFLDWGKTCSCSSLFIQLARWMYTIYCTVLWHCFLTCHHQLPTPSFFSQYRRALCSAKLLSLCWLGAYIHGYGLASEQ